MIILTGSTGCHETRRQLLPESTVFLDFKAFSALRYHASLYPKNPYSPSFEIWGDSQINANVNASLRYQYPPPEGNLQRQPAQVVSMDLRMPLAGDRHLLGLEFIRLFENHLGIDASTTRDLFLRAANETQEKEYEITSYGPLVSTVVVKRNRERNGLFLTISFYERDYFHSAFQSQTSVP